MTLVTQVRYFSTTLYLGSPGSFITIQSALSTKTSRLRHTILTTLVTQVNLLLGHNFYLSFTLLPHPTLYAPFFSTSSESVSAFYLRFTSVKSLSRVLITIEISFDTPLCLFLPRSALLCDGAKDRILPSSLCLSTISPICLHLYILYTFTDHSDPSFLTSSECFSAFHLDPCLSNLRQECS